MIKTKIFWRGYRAFVMGGKYLKRDKTFRIVGATGGIEPPESFSEELKQVWRDGIEYGRKERIECRQFRKKREHGRRGVLFSDKEKELLELFKKTPNFAEISYKEIGEMLGVSFYWASVHCRKHKLPHNDKRLSKTPAESLARLKEFLSRKNRPSFKKIAQEIGMSTSWVQDAARKLRAQN